MIFRFGDTREQTYKIALEDVNDFLRINKCIPPGFVAGPPPRAYNKWQNYGLYIPSYSRDGSTPATIYVNVPKAAMPTKERTRIWSYPGHKTDRTPAGILAHEVGHHIDRACMRLSQTYKWVNVWLSLEESITSYEPNESEGFAETMRLFILNPDLLQQGRPKRYQFLLDAGLLPRPRLGSWLNILQDAPEHIQAAAAKFAEGAK